MKFTHIGTGSAEVKEVASNRRVLGADGKVKFTRTSATKNKEARDAPEGLIDPKLRTLSFWDGDKPLAALHFYACHPMSYYGDGRVSADFCGLARQKLQDETRVFQVYFNGCGGNVTAGKYNDGAKENRPVLRDRIHAAMVAAWKDTKKTAVKDWDWRFEPVKLPPRKEASFGAEESKQVLEDGRRPPRSGTTPRIQLAWLKRKDTPIEVNCLDFGGTRAEPVPAGRGVHRVPARGPEDAAGRGGERRGLRRRRARLHPDREGVPRRRLRADGRARGPGFRSDPAQGDAEAAEGGGKGRRQVKPLLALHSRCSRSPATVEVRRGRDRRTRPASRRRSSRRRSRVDGRLRLPDQARRGEGSRPVGEGPLPRRRRWQAPRAGDDRPDRHPAARSDDVAAEVEKKHGIKRDELMLTASHTHCGPVVRENLIDMYPLTRGDAARSRAYTKKLKARSRRGHRRGGEGPEARDAEVRRRARRRSP